MNSILAASQPRIILSIESAIAGGSLSVIRNGVPKAGTTGGHSVSRAEDLLIGLDALLCDAGVSKLEIDAVAVSVGPGSFTGLRIGLSTAKGLSAALGVPCIGVNLFSAIAAAVEREALIVLPMGRSDLCYGLISGEFAAGTLHVGGTGDLESFVQKVDPKAIAFHSEVSDILTALNRTPTSTLVNVGSNMADHIGRFAFANPEPNSLDPLYVQNPRFR